MTIRTGLVGLGNIGKEHLQLLTSEAVGDLELVAICSSQSADMPGMTCFTSYDDLLRADLCEAIVLATPTMTHPDMVVRAIEADQHVLVEKPVAMSVGQAQSVVECVPAELQCGVMLNQRFHPVFAAIKRLLDDGAIGPLVRYHWTMTAWYRPDVYYQVSRWRGTWAGEGGGLLINQCIHNLDVMQWWLGLPDRVQANVAFGKYHDIDVEDEVTALFQHDNGVTGTLIASSGEAPGINALDIVGDRGMLRYDGDTLTLWQRDGSVAGERATTRDMFAVPEFVRTSVATDEVVNQHAMVFNNFADAVNGTGDLLTPLSEGLGSLQLANGILLSAWTGEVVDLPMAADRYERELGARIAGSGFRQPQDVDVHIDMDQSYR